MSEKLFFSHKVSPKKSGYFELFSCKSINIFEFGVAFDDCVFKL